MATQDPVIYVVADGEKARFLRLEGSQLRTIENFDIHKGSDAAKDVGSLKAAHTSPKEQLKTHFAKDLAAHINKVAQDSNIEGIFLVASAQSLHDIRENLDKPTSKKLFKSLTKDLTNTPDHELLKHLDRPETGWSELASV